MAATRPRAWSSPHPRPRRRANAPRAASEPATRHGNAKRASAPATRGRIAQALRRSLLALHGWFRCADTRAPGQRAASLREPGDLQLGAAWRRAERSPRPPRTWRANLPRLPPSFLKLSIRREAALWRRVCSVRITPTGRLASPTLGTWRRSTTGLHQAPSRPVLDPRPAGSVVPRRGLTARSSGIS